jgi:hypothetical protein
MAENPEATKARRVDVRAQSFHRGNRGLPHGRVDSKTHSDEPSTEYVGTKPYKPHIRTERTRCDGAVHSFQTVR